MALLLLLLVLLAVLLLARRLDARVPGDLLAVLADEADDPLDRLRAEVRRRLHQASLAARQVEDEFAHRQVRDAAEGGADAALEAVDPAVEDDADLALEV